MSSIGIVIVTCNSEAEIGACLDAALASGAQVIVVDNASADGTRQEVSRRGVRLLANESNRGFAAAVNQGVQALDTPWILLLNPDAVLLSGLEPLRACSEKPLAAGAGGCLVDERGQPQIGFMLRRLPSPLALAFEALLLNRLWPRNPVNWRYRCLGCDYGAEQEAEQPAGAFLMLRRDVWNELHGMDERYYPLWFEDVDYCKRARDRGFRMFYSPQAVAKHTGGHSISKIALEIRTIYWYGNLLRYASRHFRPWAVRGVAAAILLGSVVRMVRGIFHRRSLQPVVAYSRVMRLAGHCMIFGRKDRDPLYGRID